ncbi:single-stranded DNA-binding protein [Anaerovorax sp. IOR16]|uniref:single-stranded DNA-binding protein n=1 Tax=Anaerovorax sp. IOR16 TaxID=2773458 RepID=UPI0019D1196B
MENGFETNSVELLGTIISDAVFSHKSYGELFYSFTLGVERKSGYQDEIQIIVSERLIWKTPFSVGQRAHVFGQIRTYNEAAEGRNRLNVVVFAREFHIDEENLEDENRVFLEGFVCKVPVGRVSPLGREICDIMLAVNRMYNKSDYIPCIAWGRNAGYTSKLEVGSKLSVTGRIQSREYRKKDEEGNITIKIAYEVSILKIEA